MTGSQRHLAWHSGSPPWGAFPSKPAHSRHWRLGGWGLVLLLGLGLGSCDRLWDSTPTDVSLNEGSGQFIRRTLGGKFLVSQIDPIQLKLTRGWQPAPPGILHDSAELNAFNPDQAMYFIAVGENRATVGADSLDNQAMIYLDLFKRGFDRVTSSEERTSLNNVGGFPAVQYRIQGEVLGAEVAYLHTTIQLGGQFYQVVVWTPEERYYENVGAMEDIVQQFGEI
jgi:hypothetical protein